MVASSSTGVFIGVAAPSVVAGVILVVYGGNQILALPMVPTILNISNAALFTITMGAAIASITLVLATLLFNRKQL
jgi:hypothetical protein